MSMYRNPLCLFGFKDFPSKEKIADLISFQRDELASSCGFCVRKTQEIGDFPRFENYTKIEDWISHYIILDI